ncbi:hypothetical protein GCM10025789_08490 [Tessaracoccus lubricantis]|uniref:Major facilitator superfamily (MFS) profile domain-containing protein n=1 Tax=Tessaracoccus lubricantis TaxID=545543 RepID=A0ABP9F3Z0_9ACTN
MALDVSRATATQRVMLGVAFGYLCTFVPALLGFFAAAQVPCEGLLCWFESAFVGSCIGLGLGIIVAAFVGRRLGLRWWFGPVLLVLFALSLGLPFMVAGAGWEAVLLGLLAPVLAALSARPPKGLDRAGDAA